MGISYLNYETSQSQYIRYGVDDLKRADLQSKLAEHIPQNLYTQEPLNIPAGKLKNYTQFRNNIIFKTPALNTGYLLLQGAGDSKLPIPYDMDPSNGKRYVVSGLSSDGSLMKYKNVVRK